MDDTARAAAYAEIREVLGTTASLRASGLILDAVWPIAVAAARREITEDCPYVGCIPRVEARCNPPVADEIDGTGRLPRGVHGDLLTPEEWHRLCLRAFENLPTDTAVTIADVDAILTWCLSNYASGQDVGYVRARAVIDQIQALASGWLKDGPDGAPKILAERVLATIADAPRPEGAPLSLGEQLHDPTQCDRDGEPHLGPCVEPSDDQIDAESYCHRCGRPNTVWSAPSPLWNAVMRDGSINGSEQYDGIVCLGCFAQLAEGWGVAGHWHLSARKVYVALEAVTPSGRVWDEATQLWREPDAGRDVTCSDERTAQNDAVEEPPNA